MVVELDGRGAFTVRVLAEHPMLGRPAQGEWIQGWGAGKFDSAALSIGPFCMVPGERRADS
jgi:hypothetical protein